ncbi:Hint domain-containing protein [Arenibacterium sp. CAU 1754]
MATYQVQFYNFDPATVFGTTVGSTYLYAQEALPSGTATITDNQFGIDGATLDDDNAGETATITATINGNTSFGVPTDAEIVWTILDQTTGETFEIVQLDIEGGGAGGFYTLSEQPLIQGHTYEVLAYDTFPDAGAGDTTFQWTDYVGVVDGTGGDDTITPGYTDTQGDVVEGETVESVFSWEALGDGATGTSFNQTVNDVQVAVTIADDGAFETATVVNDPVYNGPGETFDTDSSLLITGDNDLNDDGIVDQGNNTATITIDFSAATTSVEDEVQNVIFRINDFDVAAFVDIATITAYDADGNPVPVTITGGGFQTVNGNTVTGTGTAGSDWAEGSVLVEIPGPVSQIVFDYDNGGVNTQGIWLSDIQFDAVSTFYDDVIDAGDGADVIDAGLGDDVVYAGTGDDVITGGAGDDTLYGGAGSDTFIGGEGADVNDGSTGQDTVDYTGSDAAVNVDLSTGTFSGGYAEGDTGPGIDGIIGSDFDDTLIGFDGQGFGPDAYTNILDGGAGDDFIDGRAGDDILFGGDGTDTIIGGAGADTLDGGAGDDILSIGGGDTADGGAGDDTFNMDASLLDGSDIYVDGLETAEDGTGDALFLNGSIVEGSIVKDPNNPENGYATLIGGGTIFFSNIERIICFARGTFIETEQGPRAIETLRAGDLIVTRDHGLQPLRWTGSRTVAATGDFAPIRLRKDALDNKRDLIVSPQHRMLITGWRAEILFGETEVLAAAKHLVNDRDISCQEGGMVEYFHLMFDRHEVIFAEDAPTESFHPTEESLEALDEPARDELLTLFPELRVSPANHGDTARRCLRSFEARLLAA